MQGFYTLEVGYIYYFWPMSISSKVNFVLLPCLCHHMVLVHKLRYSSKLHSFCCSFPPPKSKYLWWPPFIYFVSVWLQGPRERGNSWLWAWISCRVRNKLVDSEEQLSHLQVHSLVRRSKGFLKIGDIWSPEWTKEQTFWICC